MGKVYDRISPELSAWIERQPLFFVATAPLSPDGHVNTSPKGLDCLRIIDPRQLAYLDVTGSGAETIAHVRENGRIVLMFCAFVGAPKIVRLHGEGSVVTQASPDWSAWSARFPDLTAPRSVIVVDITRISDSCGYGVPRMDFVEHRNALTSWAEKKGDAALPAYRRAKNRASIDGLPALDESEA